MKTINLKSIALLFIAALTFFTSCKKDDAIVNDVPEVHDNSVFSCTLDGVEYETGGVFAYAVNDISGDAVRVYGVTDMTGEGTIYIEMPLDVSTGARAMSEDVFAYVVIGDKAHATLFGAPVGTVTITKRTDEVIEGTFNFTAYDSDDLVTEMKVENGNFKVRFRD